MYCVLGNFLLAVQCYLLLVLVEIFSLLIFCICLQRDVLAKQTGSQAIPADVSCGACHLLLCSWMEGRLS